MSLVGKYLPEVTAMPDENGPLAVMTRPPLLPMASPRLRLLRNLERPLARRSSAARSFAFFSSSRASASRSASSLRTFFGRNLAVAPRVARAAVAPLPAKPLEETGVLRADEVVGCGVGVELGASASWGSLLPAAEAPLPRPRPVVRPRTML